MIVFAILFTRGKEMLMCCSSHHVENVLDILARENRCLTARCEFLVTLVFFIIDELIFLYVI